MRFELGYFIVAALALWYSVGQDPNLISVNGLVFFIGAGAALAFLRALL